MSDTPSPAAISQLLRSRASIFPAMYTDEPIDKAIIEEMLENANWAPNHKKTEPWRFKVFRGDARQRLADFMSSWYKENTPAESFSEKKFKKLSTNPLKADTVIAIIMQRDPIERLPEWEEVAAVACAVQNMWLTSTAYGLGGYWSSPSIMTQHANAFLELGPKQRCLGLFYLAHHQAPELARERGDIQDKVEWLEK